MARSQGEKARKLISAQQARRLGQATTTLLKRMRNLGASIDTTVLREDLPKTLRAIQLALSDTIEYHARVHGLDAREASVNLFNVPFRREMSEFEREVCDELKKMLRSPRFRKLGYKGRISQYAPPERGRGTQYSLIIHWKTGLRSR